MPRPVFLIFEGGGAMGITHAGAVKAVEQDGLEIAGVAGASAGAIVAALVAIGYRADELLEPSRSATDPKRDIFHAHGASPTAVLGDRDWRLFRLLTGRPAALLILVLLLLSPLLLFVALALLVACGLKLAGLSGPWGLARRLGFFDPGPAAAFLDRVLIARAPAAVRAAVAADGPGARLRFRHIDPARGSGLPPLKIAVTDLAAGGLRIIDRRSPEASVADTVVASMSIPLVFRPASIDGLADAGPFVDGGLVDNLPSWVFIEEKLALERRRPDAPPIPVIALSLDSRSSGAVTRHNLLTYVGRVIHTGIFGSQATVSRFVPNLVAIRLISPLDVLDFDCSWAEAVAAFTAGQQIAADAIRARVTLGPDGRIDRLRRTRDGLAGHCTRLGLDPASLRLGLLRLPEADSLALHCDVSVGRERDGDQTLSYDLRSPAAPAAFVARDVHLLHLHALGAAELMMSWADFARQPRTLCSLLAVPLFDRLEDWNRAAADRPQPHGVLAVDGAIDLQPLYQDAEAMRWLAQESVALVRILNRPGKAS